MFILYILIEFCVVKQSLNIQSVTGEQLDIHELNSLIDFPSGRRTSFLHSNRLAALRSVSLRLQSLNQKTLTDITDATESLHGFVFLFDLSFDFRLILIVPWQDKGDFRRILV